MAATFSDIGGAVSDLFAAEGYKTRAAGRRIEAQEYDLAGELSRQNETFTRESTDIKQAQLSRSIYQTIGQQGADVASSGFEASGSALDLLRSSAQQGALTKAVVGQQGLIQEAGYEEQAKSYTLMSSASRMAADADETAATGAKWAAAIKGVSAVAGLFGGSMFGGGPTGSSSPGGGSSEAAAAA